LLLVLFFTYFNEYSLFVSKQDPAMEIVLDERPRESILVAAPTNETEQKIQPKDEARFKSSQTQRTELETWKRPTQPQDFRTNVHLESGGQKGDTETQETETSQTQTDEGDWAINDQRKPLPLPGFGNSGERAQVPSYVQDSLPPGVRLGNVTSLNTDQHKYYSFNHRLLSRFIPVWGRQVRRALYQWLDENNAPGVSKVWVTNVEIIMDPTGEIIEVQPFRLSGLWSIDEAAIESFKQIRQVPNPPKELVDENGYIHLQFQTEVYWVPQPGMRYQGGGPGR
jgi:hypothetical protein